MEDQKYILLFYYRKAEIQFKQDKNYAMWTEKMYWPNANAKIGLQNFVSAISILRMHHVLEDLLAVGRCKSSTNNSRYCRKIKSDKRDRHMKRLWSISKLAYGFLMFLQNEICFVAFTTAIILLDVKETIYFYRRLKVCCLQPCNAQETMV